MRASLVAFVCLAGCSGPTGDGSHEDSTLDTVPASLACARSILVDESIRPVQGAHITIEELDWVTLTGDDGAYTYLGVPKGNFTVLGHWEGDDGKWREARWHIHIKSCADFLQSQATITS